MRTSNVRRKVRGNILNHFRKLLKNPKSSPPQKETARGFIRKHNKKK